MSAICEREAAAPRITVQLNVTFCAFCAYVNVTKCQLSHFLASTRNCLQGDAMIDIDRRTFLTLSLAAGTLAGLATRLGTCGVSTITVWRPANQRAALEPHGGAGRESK